MLIGLMGVGEAKDMCQDHGKWNVVVICVYLDGKKAYIICTLNTSKAAVWLNK